MFLMISGWDRRRPSDAFVKPTMIFDSIQFNMQTLFAVEGEVKNQDGDWDESEWGFVTIWPSLTFYCLTHTHTCMGGKPLAVRCHKNTRNSGQLTCPHVLLSDQMKWTIGQFLIIWFLILGRWWPVCDAWLHIFKEWFAWVWLRCVGSVELNVNCCWNLI